MVEAKGILHVYDFTPEELEVIYDALRYHLFWGTPEDADLARKIEKVIEIYLRD